MRIVTVVICAGILPSAFCQDAQMDAAETKAMAAPALPLYYWGACPY